jgi:hypothetical protein
MRGLRIGKFPQDLYRRRKGLILSDAADDYLKLNRLVRRSERLLGRLS